MKSYYKVSGVFALFLLAALVIGCVGNGGSKATPTAEPTPMATPAMDTTAPPMPPADDNTQSGSVSMVQQATNGRTYPTTPLIDNGSSPRAGGQMAGELGNQHT